MAAKSSYMSYLMYKATSGADYTKLCDVKSYPDMGGTPERLETTTLSDAMQTFCEGIQQLNELQYVANYESSLMTTLAGMSGKQYDFAEWFGANASGTPDGSDGKFSFTGSLSAFASGKGVNEVREITITISNSTPITFSAS